MWGNQTLPGVSVAAVSPQVLFSPGRALCDRVIGEMSQHTDFPVFIRSACFPEPSMHTYEAVCSSRFHTAAVPSAVQSRNSFLVSFDVLFGSQRQYILCLWA